MKYVHLELRNLIGRFERTVKCSVVFLLLHCSYFSSVKSKILQFMAADQLFSAKEVRLVLFFRYTTY